MGTDFGPAARRFRELAEVPGLYPPVQTALRLLLLADDLHPANAVQEHIHGVSVYSAHRVTTVNTRQVTSPDAWRSGDFDAILIHYSIYVIADTYLSPAWQQFVATFQGVVAIIHEDEYQHINAFKRKFEQLGVQAVFSCLDSTANLERVYGGDTLLQHTQFFCCLPGYVSPAMRLLRAPPVHGRRLHLGYRGRTLAPELGRFAQEKRLIGEEMHAIASAAGLACDVSSAEHDRIYGAQWPDFLMSCKATLGVEGGASIFDFDGDIRAAVSAYKLANPEASFDAIWSAVLAPHEGNIQFRTITPKFFEAIATKTALVLYPGHYRGVLEPGRHYIELQRNGSNAADVVARLKDDEYLQELVDRTSREVLCKPELSSSFYVAQIDRVLSALAKVRPRQFQPVDMRPQTLDAPAQLSRPDPIHGELAFARDALSVALADLATAQQGLAVAQRNLTATQSDLALAQQSARTANESLAQSRDDKLMLSDRLARAEAQLRSVRSLAGLLLKAVIRRIKIRTRTLE